MVAANPTTREWGMATCPVKNLSNGRQRSEEGSVLVEEREKGG
jgi:hypothetical protein